MGIKQIVDFPVIGGSNHQRSAAFDSQLSVNCYPFYDPVSKSWIMYPYAGSKKLLDLNVGANDFKGRPGGHASTEQKAFVVVGNIVFEIDVSLTATEIGTIATTTGFVSMVIVYKYLVIVDGSGKWVYDIELGTFNAITNPAAPLSPTYATEQQGFALLNDAGTQKLTQAAQNQPQNYNALATIQINYRSSYLSYPLIAQESINGRIFCFTTGFIEVVENEGKAGFTFLPDENLVFGYGLLNAASLAKGTGGNPNEELPEFLIFPSLNPDTGTLKVMMTNGNPPRVISTPSIEYRLTQLMNKIDGVGFIWSTNGQTFYQLSYTTDQVTFVYHLNSDKWFDAQYNAGRHFAETAFYFAGKILCTSYLDNGLYELSEQYLTNSDVPINIIRITENLRITGYKKLTGHLLRFWFQQGVGLAGRTEINSPNYTPGSNPVVYISISFDGGITFPINFSKTLGTIGNRLYVTDVDNLGTERDWTLKIEYTQPCDFYLMGAQFTYTASEGTQ